jgi:hypothetical protein
VTSTAPHTIGRLQALLSPESRGRARRPHPFARPAALAAAVAAVLALTLSACGSSQGNGTSVDPASAVPATAAIYVGADVHPQGAERAGALAAGSALTHQANPYLRLLALLRTPGSPTLDFSKDVAPWLGPHAGLFLSSLAGAERLGSLLQNGLLGSGTASQSAFPFGAGRAQGSIVMDTSDPPKAREFLDRQARRAGAHAASYRGVAVQSSSGAVAFALVRRLAVVGSLEGVHAVIDTVSGGPPLSAQFAFAKLSRAAPAGALAHLFVNPGTSTAQASGASRGLLGLLSGGRATNVSLLAKAGSIALDADTLASSSSGSASAPRGLLSPDPEAATALSELPGDAWLAVGLGHLGESLGKDVGGLTSLVGLGGSLGSSRAGSAGVGLDVKSLIAGLLAPLRILGGENAGAKADYASWMGSGGIFASGGSLLELRAAVVISSKDPARSRAAVAKLAAQLRRSGGSLRPVQIPGTDAAVGVALPGLPAVLDIAAGRDAQGRAKFVLGLAEVSVSAALAPSSTLASSASRSVAATALGEGIQPSLMLDVPTLVSLLEGVGLTEDPSIAPAVPYLRASSSVSGGARAAGGEVQRFRLVLGLQSSGG